jgi:two-component system response regulator PilR (NtrC family)
MTIGPDAMDLLSAYPWPGNVRELENVIERAVALTTGDTVQADNLPPVVQQPVASPGSPQFEVPPEGLDLEEVVADLERRLMQDALEKAEGVQTRAAQLLGINFRSFRYRAKKYGLDRHSHDRDHGKS